MDNRQKTERLSKSLAKSFSVPSPLVGEGQDGGAHVYDSTIRPLTLSLSHEGRGDLYSAVPVEFVTGRTRTLSISSL